MGNSKIEYENYRMYMKVEYRKRSTALKKLGVKKVSGKRPLRALRTK